MGQKVERWPGTGACCRSFTPAYATEAAGALFPVNRLSADTHPAMMAPYRMATAMTFAPFFLLEFVAQLAAGQTCGPVLIALFNIRATKMPGSV